VQNLIAGSATTVAAVLENIWPMAKAAVAKVLARKNTQPTEADEGKRFSSRKHDCSKTWRLLADKTSVVRF